jgi:hypothetical protein
MGRFILIAIVLAVGTAGQHFERAALLATPVLPHAPYYRARGCQTKADESIFARGQVAFGHGSLPSDPAPQ